MRPARAVSGRSILRTLVVAAALSAAILAAITWWALEASGVAVVVTHARSGGTRASHVWYAEDGRGLWLEAGSPESEWCLDVLADPEVEVRIDGVSARYRASVIRNHEAQERVRKLLREKYGLRDRWVALLVDVSRSVAVRLVPVVPPEGSPGG